MDEKEIVQAILNWDNLSQAERRRVVWEVEQKEISKSMTEGQLAALLPDQE